MKSLFREVRQALLGKWINFFKFTRAIFEDIDW